MAAQNAWRFLPRAGHPLPSTAYCKAPPKTSSSSKDAATADSNLAALVSMQGGDRARGGNRQKKHSWHAYTKHILCA